MLPEEVISATTPFARMLPEATGPETAPLKVSILMCALNEEQTITQAVHEILETNYPCDIELIVVDDGSTDNTVALVAQIDDRRVILHRHGENRGEGSALRTASALATSSAMTSASRKTSTVWSRPLEPAFPRRPVRGSGSLCWKRWPAECP